MAVAKFEVFQGVDLVKTTRTGGAHFGPRDSKYPVKDLQVGYAFFVPLAQQDLEEGEEPVDLEGMVKRVQGAVTRQAKNLNYKLAVRKLPASDDASRNPWGEDGVGVWRLEGHYTPRTKKAA